MLKVENIGNTQARVPELPQLDCSFHAKAGRGEITRDDVKLEQYVDIADEHGLTALHWAASYGQLNSCQDLVWYVTLSYIVLCFHFVVLVFFNLT